VKLIVYLIALKGSINIELLFQCPRPGQPGPFRRLPGKTTMTAAVLYFDGYKYLRLMCGLLFFITKRKVAKESCVSLQ